MFQTSYAMRKTARNHRTKGWRHGAPERCGDQSDFGDCRTAKKPSSRSHCLPA
jgi:hypothetical protein